MPVPLSGMPTIRSVEVGRFSPRARRSDDIAKAVSFLSSDDFNYVSGIELLVGGERQNQNRVMRKSGDQGCSQASDQDHTIRYA